MNSNSSKDGFTIVDYGNGFVFCVDDDTGTILGWPKPNGKYKILAGNDDLLNKINTRRVERLRAEKQKRAN